MPGIYLYIGSAFGSGGLRARIAHHRKIATRPHWHIDYLRPKTSLKSAWYSCDADKREHLWAEVAGEMDGATVLLGRFGARDCSCATHLFYFAKMFDEACFKKLLIERCPGHGAIHVEAFTGIDFFPVVTDSVEEEIEGDILGEHWGLEMGEKPTTRQLDSWGKIKAE